MTSIDRDGDAFEQALLDSAKDDGMRPARKAALAASLGVGGSALVAAGTAKAAAAGVAASKAKAAATMLAVKLLAAAAVGSAVVVGVGTTIHYARDVRSAERAPSEHANGMDGRPPPLAARAVGAASAAIEASAASPPAAEPALDAPPPPAVVPAAPADAVARVGTTAHAGAPSLPSTAAPRRPAVLGEEQRTIERARAALAAGDVTEARRALDDHDRAFPAGAFGDEAELLRIDLLSRSGAHDRARREARAFLARTPESPYAARLRELAGAPDEP